MANNSKDIKKEVEQDIKDIASITEVAFRTITDSIKDLFDDALTSGQSIIKTVSKDMQKSLNSLVKDSNNLVINQSRINKGLYTQKDISKQLLANEDKLYKLELQHNAALQIIKEDTILSEQEKMELIKGINQEYSKALDYNHLFTDQLHQQSEQLGEVEKTMGNVGTLAEGLSKGLQKAGLGALDTRLGIGDALADTRKMVIESEGTATNLDASKHFAKQLGSNLFKAIDPTTLIVAGIKELVDTFKLVDNSVGDTAKKFNLTYTEALNVNEELTRTANLSNDAAVTTEKLRKTMIAVGSALGSNAVLNEKDLTTFTKLTEQAGYQTDELMEIEKLSLSQGKSLEDNTKEILGGAQAYAAQNKLVVNEKEVLKEVNKAGAAIKLSLKGSADELARSVVQAKQFGLNLEQADKISSSLLDFESSISNELDAELMTGKNLNLETARQLALNNDIAGAAAEVAKQVGSAEEFGKMNRLQQEAIAKSVGLQRDELAQSLIDKEALTKLSAKEGETSQQAFDRLVKEVGMEEAKKRLGDEQLANQFKQQSIQERFTQGIDKLKDLFVGLIEPVLAIVEPLVKLVEVVLPAINVLLAPLIEGFSLLGDLVTSFVSGLKEGNPLAIGLAGALGLVASKAIMGAVGAIFQSLAQIPFGVGLLLAGAAVAGLFSLVSKAQQVGDVISPANGKTQISTKEGGLLELSPNDDLIAAPGIASKGNGGGGGGSSTMIDIGPMVERLSAVENVLIQILKKEGTITLDGTKMGTAMAVGSYKIQ
jgi:DNA-binding ferritin-like protein (Dps family)